MSGLLVKAVVGVLARKATRSVTSYIGATVAAAGAATVIDPTLIGMIPDQYRGYVGMGVGAAVILARHRQDIIDMYAKLRAELKMAIKQAEEDVK